MRTTVTLADDVAAEVARLRKGGLGTSEAINQLARAGMAGSSRKRSFRQHTASLGLRLDVSNIAEVLETLDDDDR